MIAQMSLADTALTWNGTRAGKLTRLHVEPL